MPQNSQAAVMQYISQKMGEAKLTAEEVASLYKLFDAGAVGFNPMMSGTLGFDPAALANRLGMSMDQFQQFVRAGNLARTGGNYEEARQMLGIPSAEETAAQQAGAAEDMKNKAAADDLAARLDKFAKYMMDPLDMQDPTVLRIMQNANAQIGHGIYGSGAGGGMAQAAMAKGVADAGSQLYQQRAALGASVMGGRLQDQRQLNAYRDQANRMALDDKYNNQLSQWEAGRGGAQQIGGIIGAGLGALPGIFTLNPGLAVTGASAGYGMGAGIGGSTYGGPPSKPVYNSPYYGGGMSSSGRMGY